VSGKKLRKTYDGVGDNLRFYQILNDIEACVQGEGTVQEYSIELDHLWLDHDYCTRSFSCPEPACKKSEICMCVRTMRFLRRLVINLIYILYSIRVLSQKLCILC
jgi:hypothetical protein